MSCVLISLNLTGTTYATYICNVPRRPTWGRIGSTAATAETSGITIPTTTPAYRIHCSPTTLLPVTSFSDKWALSLLHGAGRMVILCLIMQTNSQGYISLYWYPHSMAIAKPMLICGKNCFPLLLVCVCVVSWNFHMQYCKVNMKNVFLVYWETGTLYSLKTASVCLNC